MCYIAPATDHPTLSPALHHSAHKAREEEEEKEKEKDEELHIGGQEEGEFFTIGNRRKRHILLSREVN